MASEAARRAAGAQGIGAPEEPEPKKRGTKEAKPGKTSLEKERALASPVELRIKAERGEFRITTQFTIGDIVQKRVLDDLQAFVWLVMVEVNAISGYNLNEPALLFHDQIQKYFAVALRTSNVVEFLNTRLLLKVAQLFNAEDNRIAFTLADLNGLDQADTTSISIHFVARWIDSQRKNR